MHRLEARGKAPLGWPGSEAQAEVAKAVTGPLKEQLTTLGLVPGGTSSEEFAAFVAAEVAKWREVAKTAGITAE